MAAVESTSTPVANKSSKKFPLNDSPVPCPTATSNVAQENEDSKNSNELTISDIEGVDPPRDSGIDLGVSFNDEIDEDILDLNRFEEMDDEESWLYSTPAAKKTNDILSWLRKDVDNLDTNTRRSLAIKLELILRNKQLEKENDEEIHKNANETAVERPAPIVRRKTFSADPPSLDEKTTKKVQETHQKNAQRKLTPTLTVSKPDDDRLSDAIDDFPTLGRRSLDEMLKDLTHKQSDINPDLKDIRLLASMQEQDLRQCLQQLQLSNSQRRRTSSDRQELVDGQTKQNALAPAAPPIRVSSPKSPRPSSASGESKSYATYTKPVRQSTYDADERRPAPIAATPKVISTNRHGSASDSRTRSAVSSLMVTQMDAGLQKSLPNLAASKSCEALKAEATMSASTSEKGSYGEVNVAGSSPTGSTQKISNGHKPMPSRLPTPRSRLPTPSRQMTSSKTGIPANRANTPASKLSLPAHQTQVKEPPAHQTQVKEPPAHQTQVKEPPAHQTDVNDTWKDGCI